MWAVLRPSTETVVSMALVSAMVVMVLAMYGGYAVVAWAWFLSNAGLCASSTLGDTILISLLAAKLGRPLHPSEPLLNLDGLTVPPPPRARSKPPPEEDEDSVVP